MTQTTWGDIYKGGDRQSVPGGTYTVQISAARPYAKSSMLFLDLQVLSGPEAGKIGQVNLFVPDPGAKGSFFFQKKIGGMIEGPPPGFLEALELADKEQALNLLATALEGRTFTAELSVRTDGDYAGSNELESTKPLDGAPAQVAPAAAPVAAPAPVVAQPAPPPPPPPPVQQNGTQQAAAVVPVGADDVPF